jgi:hypothetical protein
MTPTIDIDIGALALRGWPFERKDHDVPQLLEQALSRVAERLARSPLGRAGVRELAFERLELDAIPAEELLGPRGAERLADELYAAMTRALPVDLRRSLR